jgi:hypothetical protein
LFGIAAGRGEHLIERCGLGAEQRVVPDEIRKYHVVRGGGDDAPYSERGRSHWHKWDRRLIAIRVQRREAKSLRQAADRLAEVLRQARAWLALDALEVLLSQRLVASLRSRDRQTG